MSHLIEKLKSLQGNLLLMQDLKADVETDEVLKAELKKRIGIRIVEIEAMKRTIYSKGLVVIPAESNVFIDNTHFYEVKGLEARI